MAEARAGECDYVYISDAFCAEVDVCALGHRKKGCGDCPVTPLAVAVSNDHVNVVDMLISAGADVNAVFT